MTLTIHWSKCDVPHVQVVKDVEWVSLDTSGLLYKAAGGVVITVPDSALADAWEVKR